MKKKILISVLTLISSFLLFYTFDCSISYLKAASTGMYATSSAVTGRVNIAPGNLQGSKEEIGMKKGDRYYLGVNHIDGSSLGWQLIVDSSNITVGTVDEQSWLAMSTTPLTKVAAFNSVPAYYYYPSITASTLVAV